MMRRAFRPRDCVVYRKAKYTTHPGRRARDIRASSKGEYYSYLVDKFWVVGQVLSNGQLLLKTRRGKIHVVDRRDPNLRRPTLWDWIRHRERFAQLLQSEPGQSIPRIGHP